MNNVPEVELVTATTAASAPRAKISQPLFCMRMIVPLETAAYPRLARRNLCSIGYIDRGREIIATGTKNLVAAVMLLQKHVGRIVLAHIPLQESPPTH